MAKCVQTIDSLPKCTNGQHFRHCQLRINIFQIPFEWFTMKSIPELDTIINATKDTDKDTDTYHISFCTSGSKAINKEIAFEFDSFSSSCFCCVSHVCLFGADQEEKSIIVLSSISHIYLPTTCSVVSLLLTFRMGYFLLTAPPHNNTACNRPSTLRPRVVCFSQIHCHYRRGTYTGDACGTVENSDNFVLLLASECA